MSRRSYNSTGGLESNSEYKSENLMRDKPQVTAINNSHVPLSSLETRVLCFTRLHDLHELLGGDFRFIKDHPRDDQMTEFKF